MPRKLAWFCNSHAIARSCHGFNLCWGAWTLNYVGTRMVLVMYRIDCDSGGLMEWPKDCPMVSFGIDWYWSLVLWNQAVSCKFWGFHSVIKGCSLLGHHTALLDKLCLTFQWTHSFKMSGALTQWFSVIPEDWKPIVLVNNIILPGQVVLREVCKLHFLLIGFLKKVMGVGDVHILQWSKLHLVC